MAELDGEILERLRTLEDEVARLKAERDDDSPRDASPPDKIRIRLIKTHIEAGQTIYPPNNGLNDTFACDFVDGEFPEQQGNPGVTYEDRYASPVQFVKVLNGYLGKDEYAIAFEIGGQWWTMQGAAVCAALKQFPVDTLSENTDYFIALKDDGQGGFNCVRVVAKIC